MDDDLMLNIGTPVPKREKVQDMQVDMDAGEKPAKKEYDSIL